MLLMIGMWFYSSRHLFGGFIKAVGFNQIFGEGTNTKPMVAITTEEVKPFFISTPVAEITQQVSEVITPDPTPTPGPTQTPVINDSYFEIFLDPRYPVNPMGINLFVDRSNYYRDYYQGIAPSFSIVGRYSFYWPPYGGINCDNECTYMASGLRAMDYVGIAWACPMDLPDNAVLHIKTLDIWGQCLDRGGLILREPNGVYWLDQLINLPLIPFGSRLDVDVYQ